jgi:hypothetical protein
MPEEKPVKLDTAAKVQAWCEGRGGWDIFEPSIYSALLGRDSADLYCLGLTGVIERDFWCIREQLRLHYHEYQWLPKTVWPTIGSPSEPRHLHVLHLSRIHPGKVAYTPSPEYGRQDRQVVTTIGKYLTKYYSDVYSAEEIRNFANELRAATTISDVLFAETADEIESVYMRSAVASCMSKPLESFRGHMHPVRIYGGSDLAVAYLEDSKQRVTARTVVWPDKKIWVRLYGDDVLRIKLEDAGYEQKSLDGARLPLIRNESGDGYIAPYIDGAAQDFDVEGDYLVIVHGGDLQCSPDGITYPQDSDEDSRCCDGCGYNTNEEDLTYSEFHDQHFCGDCTSDRWTYAYHHNRCGWGESYIEEDITTYVECVERTFLTQNLSEAMAKWDFVELSHEFYPAKTFVRDEDYLCTTEGERIKTEDSVVFDDGEEIYHDLECEVRGDRRYSYPIGAETKVDPETGDVVAYDDTDGILESNYHEQTAKNTELQTAPHECVGSGVHQGDHHLEVPAHTHAEQHSHSDRPGI